MKTHIENVHDEHEVRYWTDAPGITREQLVAAVREAGPMAAAVRAKSVHQADSKTAGQTVDMTPVAPYDQSMTTFIKHSAHHHAMSHPRLGELLLRD